MRQHLVFDLPTRLFHWLFAGLFLTAFLIAKTVDDESLWFNFHSLAGLTLGFLVTLRIAWGFFGTRHARFSGFALNPKDLVSYFKGIFTGDKRRWAGHNPASSWAGVTMLAMALGLAVTGYLMTAGGDKEAFEDIHELFANGFIVLVALHVAGIIVHTVRHQDMIGLSMIDGKKAGVTEQQTIASVKTPYAILLAGLLAVFCFQLFKNFDSESRSLQFFGAKLQLGETAKHKETEHKGSGENDEATEDDDDD